MSVFLSSKGGVFVTVIGITCGHSWEAPERFYVNEAYVQQIITAGAIPILIPYMDPEKLKVVVEQIDGLLIPGGNDIDARLFGEEPQPGLGSIDPIWDMLDMTVIRFALSRNLPILGICRGCQILNVTCGGSLIQDIATQVTNPIKHQQLAPKWHGTHDISIASGSKLASVLGVTEIAVNSFHHQAIARIASGFIASAYASDGIIEGIESTQHNCVLGVQWHPELMTSHEPIFTQLFTHLVQSAKKQ